MKIEQLEKELKEIDSNLSIKPNPNNPQMAGVYYQGAFLYSIPNNEIKEHVDPQYGIEINGRFFRHRTSEEIKAMVKGQIKQINEDPDYKDATLGTGDYSEEK